MRRVMNYREKKNLLLFGTNTGDVGAFKYPSFKAVQKVTVLLIDDHSSLNQY